MTDLLEKFDHPSWFTVGGTAAAYGLLLAVMTVLLFAVPFALFLLL